MFGFTHWFEVFFSELFHLVVITEQPETKEPFNRHVWVKGRIFRRDPGFKQIDNDIPFCFCFWNVCILFKNTAWSAAWVERKRVSLTSFLVCENKENLQKRKT